MARQRTLSGRASGVKLRLGLVAHTLELEAWKRKMLETILGSSYAEIALVVVVAIPAPAAMSSAHRRSNTVRGAAWAAVHLAYERWESRYACAPDAQERSGCGTLLDRVPTCHVVAEGAAPPYSLPAEDLALLRKARLDVLLELDGARLSNAIADVATYGVWAFHHGDPERGFGTPPGFWELFFRSPITTTGAYMRDGAGQETPLLSTVSASNFNSTRLNNNARYWKAAALVPRKLEAIWNAGAVSAYDSTECARPKLTSLKWHGPPRAGELAKLLTRRIGRAFLNRAEEVLTLPQWILLFCFSDERVPRLGNFRSIAPPKDRFWADPHLVCRGGKYYVFFEEYIFSRGKGHISVITIDANGACGPAEKVLERDYHLSYPFLYEHGGELYMIPETADNRTVELYRCVDFPTRWEFVANLLEDITAFDATLLEHDGRYWLFANVIENPGASSWDELFLFSTDALLGGKWKAHPLNPIVSDVRHARPAGAIIKQDGQMFRPSQDCSVRYGYAVNMRRITKLTLQEYEEEGAGSILPHGCRGIRGVHTYARAGQLTVLDAFRPRLRF